MAITIIILIVFFSVLILAIRIAIKNRNKGESKLSVYEHSSTFKKPNIEMTSPSPEKKKQTDAYLEKNENNSKPD